MAFLAGACLCFAAHLWTWTTKGAWSHVTTASLGHMLLSVLKCGSIVACIYMMVQSIARLYRENEELAHKHSGVTRYNPLRYLDTRVHWGGDRFVTAYKIVHVLVWFGMGMTVLRLFAGGEGLQGWFISILMILATYGVITLAKIFIDNVCLQFKGFEEYRDAFQRSAIGRHLSLVIVVLNLLVILCFLTLSAFDPRTTFLEGLFYIAICTLALWLFFITYLFWKLCLDNALFALLLVGEVFDLGYTWISLLFLPLLFLEFLFVMGALRNYSRFLLDVAAFVIIPVLTVCEFYVTKTYGRTISDWTVMTPIMAKQDWDHSGRFR